MHAASQNMRRQKLILFAAALVLIGALGTWFMGRHPGGNLIYVGKPLTSWEHEVSTGTIEGKYFETVVLPAVAEMGPETIPFWIERLEYQDSALKRGYANVWKWLPGQFQASLPKPIDQWHRRQAMSEVLIHLQSTNVIPEVIRLCHSQDSEVQYLAVQILHERLQQSFPPNRECIEAFCHTLQSKDARARTFGVLGLSLWAGIEKLPELQKALKDPDEVVRTMAARSIADIQPSADVAYIFQAGLVSTNLLVRKVSGTWLPKTRSRAR